MTKEDQLEAAFVRGFTKYAEDEDVDVTATPRDLLSPRALSGLAYGAPVGAGLAGLYGFLTPSPPDRGQHDPRTLRALRYALLGGVLGGGAGVAAAPFVSDADAQRVSSMLPRSLRRAPGEAS